MPQYLVSGGAGFIGSHTVRDLVARGETVRVLDNFITGSRENLGDAIRQIELIEGDVRDGGVTREAMKDVRYCLHLAALSSVPRSIEDPKLTNDVNVNGTLNILVAARDAGVERFVFASSSSVYGNSATIPLREDTPADPLSPYALTKLAGEHYVRMFCALYRMPTVCLRYFNIFGPRQNPDSPYAAVIPIFAAAMIAGRQPTIYGDGEQSRDFCYVEDVVKATLLACSRPAEAVAGTVFNIGCGRRRTINELARQFNGLLRKRIEPWHAAPREGDIRESVADITRARRYLGFECAVGFEEGLERTVRWFEERHSAEAG